MNEVEIKSFWGAHPCGEDQVGGLEQDYEEFFRRYDAFRYTEEAHILTCFDAIDFRGKRVLEIGLGLGGDAEQMIRRGAIWSGIDLTEESVQRVRTRLKLRDLPFEALEQGSVLNMPFETASFDIVFSHGVLHHVPDVTRAQEEIARVLKPNGQLIAMLYAKRSLNYWVSIGFVRRLALMLLYASGAKANGMVGLHLRNARSVGIWRYLRMENFVHRNTDGPLNPYSKVYSLAGVARDFSRFTIVRWHQEFMHAPPLPVSKLPLARLLGWHLWVYLAPKRLGGQ